MFKLLFSLVSKYNDGFAFTYFLWSKFFFFCFITKESLFCPIYPIILFVCSTDIWILRIWINYKLCCIDLSHTSWPIKTTWEVGSVENFNLIYSQTTKISQIVCISYLPKLRTQKWTWLTNFLSIPTLPDRMQWKWQFFYNEMRVSQGPEEWASWMQ